MSAIESTHRTCVLPCTNIWTRPRIVIYVGYQVQYINCVISLILLMKVIFQSNVYPHGTNHEEQRWYLYGVEWTTIAVILRLSVLGFHIDVKENCYLRIILESPYFSFQTRCKHVALVSFIAGKRVAEENYLYQAGWVLVELFTQGKLKHCSLNSRCHKANRNNHIQSWKQNQNWQF